MDILKQINDESAAAVEQVQQSLVHVVNGGRRRRGGGAGVIYSANGIILTNRHVVRNKDYVRVMLPDGDKVRARVIGVATNYDLAALHIDRTDLPAITLGDSENVQVGEMVFATGHPWGVAGAVTSGIVIGAGDDLPERPRTGQEWIAISLHYRPGHSGGPLFDANGQMLGINTIMAGPNVGLAVPAHIARRFVEKVLKQVTV